MSRLSDPSNTLSSQCVCSYTEHLSLFCSLYTLQDPVNDLHILCSRGCSPALASVLSVHRAFMLSSLNVTVIVFKNKKVVRRSSQKPSIFVGPVKMHGDGKFPTYVRIFLTINGALNGAVVDSSEFVCDGSVTRSDDEQALVNAAKMAYLNSKQLFCMLSCKDNICHHLTFTGVSSTLREQVLDKLFRFNGVAESAEESTMDDRIVQLMQFVRQNDTGTVSYLQERVLSKTCLLYTSPSPRDS